jgi:hypothetical protein
MLRICALPRSLRPNASLSGVAKRRALCSSSSAQCVPFRRVRCSELLACRFQTPRHESPYSLLFSGLYLNHSSSTKRPICRASDANWATALHHTRGAHVSTQTARVPQPCLIVGSTLPISTRRRYSPTAAPNSAANEGVLSARAKASTSETHRSRHPS